MSADEQDPYLAPRPSAPVPGIAPDLLEILRGRRDRALAREEARRWVEELRRRRPDLVWRRPR